MARKDVSFFQQSSPESDRRRRVAQTLMEQAKQPEKTEMVGGLAVPVSNTASFARALQMGLGGYMEGSANREDVRREQGARSTMSQAMDAYGRSRAGGETALPGGDSVKWNVPSAEQSGNLYSNILMGNPDTADFGMQAQMGQMQARQASENDMDLYKQKMPFELDMARQKAAIDAQYRVPEKVPASYQEYLLAKEDPAFAAYKAKMSVDPVTGEPIRKLSATEQKEVFDIQEKTDATSGAVAALTQAKEILSRDKDDISPQPYTGWGAEARAASARIPLVGGLLADKGRAAATTEAGNLVTEQALSNMKAIFGGNPTEGERNILLKLQALPTFTPEEQKVIIDNAIAAAERRQSNFGQRLNQIKTQDYFSPISPVAPNADNSVIRSGQEGSIAVNPQTGDRLIMRNGQWVPL